MVGEPLTTRFYNPRVEVGFHQDVYALLDYDERGYLRAALLYFPNGAQLVQGGLMRLDFPGSITMHVRPKDRRQGHGTRLLDDAVSRWPEIDLTKQYTASEEGDRFLDAYMRPAPQKPV